MYQGSRFIIAATPSGVTLSSEGGAHQGVVTPALGVSIPGLTYYEPAFAREVEWIMLESVRRMGAGEGEAVLLRLSTRAIDQSLFPVALFPERADEIRSGAVGGCYRYRSAARDADARVNLFAVGVMAAEALQAMPLLQREGIDANLFVVTSPDLLYRRVTAAQKGESAGTDSGYWDPTGLLDEHEAGLPVISVIDGHPSAMAFLGSALDCPSVSLGVDTFGQSGSRTDLYRHFGIDAQGIFNASLGLVDRLRRRR